MATRTLSAIDYVILVILLLLSSVIGIIFGFFKSKKSSAKEFLLADGNMAVFPTALSISVSFLSAITLLGTPSEVYLFGTMYLYQAISITVASIVAALVFMPKFREMNFTSAYEYLEQRFDRTVRICVSITFSLIMIIYMAIVLYAPALALNQTTGLNIWLCVVSIGVICTFYSSLGGMKAVIWTDVLQAVIILVGLLATIIQGLISLGGVKRTFSIASQGQRLVFDNISPDPRARLTIWSVLIGGSFNWLSTYGFNQTLIQRYICVRSTRGAKQALFINAFTSALVLIMSSFIGIMIYAYYADCDPYTAKKIDDLDQIFPYFVMEILGDKTGLPGVFLACIFSGSLSTISSGLNSLAAVLIEDIYKGLLGRQLTDQRQGFIAKIVSVILGAVVMLLTYIVSYLGMILNAVLSLFGVLEGPIMGVFILGFFFPRANRRGGLAGFLTSLTFLLWIFLGAQITKNQMTDVSLSLSIVNCTSSNDTNEQIVFNWTTTSDPVKRDPLIDLYSISYLWYTPIAVSTVILIGMIVSYLTGPRQSHEIDPKLIISLNTICACCLPKQHNTKKDDTDVEMTVSSLPNATEKRLSTQSIRSNSSSLKRSNKIAPEPSIHSSTTKAVEQDDNNTFVEEGDLIKNK
ncbi:unnamed protein product [Adineta ricciae]|uniref:Uncharacterized protein n=1 Tax=Adineta ricciae TaxID=249248 RepID=A0A815HGV1_ADIRI|nr:unnamed protein product [Adineta ricciae]CAF1471664.1 unnamed protein product [Adineta ricciae]